MTSTAPTGSPVPRRPRPLRTTLLVVGSVLLSLVLVLAVGQTVAALDRTDHSRTAAVDGTVERVTVDGTSADVSVEYADVERARIVFDAGDTGLREEHSLSGGTLDVRLDRPGWGLFGFTVGFVRGASVTVQLPRSGSDPAVALDLRSTSGDVRAAGSFGDVTLTSTAGEVALSGSAHDLTLRSSAGDLSAQDVAVRGALHAKSAAGEVELDLATAPTSMTVDTSAGDQLVRLPAGDYAITAESTVGDVTNDLGDDRDADRSYRFTATAGDVTVQQR